MTATAPATMTAEAAAWSDASAMPAKAWMEIASAFDASTRSISRAFTDKRGTRAVPDLEALRAEIDQQLEELEARLGAALAEAWDPAKSGGVDVAGSRGWRPGEIARRCVEPLSYFLNEQVETRLTALASGDGLPDWPQAASTDDGGNAFFLEANELLDEPNHCPVVVGVYLLCLRAGFKGRYWEKREKLEAYAEKLRGDLRAATPDVSPRGVKPPARSLPLASYLGIAALALAGYQIVLLALGAAM